MTNLRLPGQYDERLLGSIGLQGPYYNWNRWYLPSVGRYLELDPLALEGAFNTPWGVDWYNYALGNPLIHYDKTGRIPIYGNWCGPDWTGGKEGSYDPSWSKYYKPPIDQLDEACRVHDICYYQCREQFPCSKDRVKLGECFRACDRDLTKAAYDFGGAAGVIVGAAIDRPGTRTPDREERCCISH